MALAHMFDCYTRFICVMHFLAMMDTCDKFENRVKDVEVMLLKSIFNLTLVCDLDHRHADLRHCQTVLSWRTFVPSNMIIGQRMWKLCAEKI